MASVYLARPTASPGAVPTYAIKRLKPRWEQDLQGVEFIRRDLAAARAVAHPNVVSILDWSVRQPPYFVVMPYLTGETLAVLVEACRRPAPPLALWITRQIAAGLSALHAGGFVHADVKPSNIMIAPDGHATLFDLGLAMVPGQQRSAAERPVVGTLHYMAPEMLLSRLAVDARSDVYSLGVSFYEMLTGRLPYEGRNPAEIAQMQREGVPDRLRCLMPHLATEIVHLVRQMLANDPLRRPTASELVERLVRLEIATLAERIPDCAA